MGRVKTVFPGIGTPINIPMTVRIIKIHRESLRVHVKLLPHGASSRNQKTKPATAPTHRRLKTVLWKRIIAIAKSPAQIHHVSGCSEGFFIGNYLRNSSGASTSIPHSFAGYPLIPQINPELPALIFVT